MTRILVAVDTDEPSGATRLAETGSRLATSENAELHLLTVVPGSGMSIVASMLPPDHADRMLEAGREELDAFAAAHLPDLPKDRLHVARGTIYDQIIKTADTLGADLIVVGAHRPDLSDYLVGPNAARVVRHANQSVYVVR